MIEKIYNSVKKEVKYWWVSLVIGIISLTLGMFCIITPDKSLVALTYIFVAAFIIGGLLEIYFALSNRKILSSWGWSLTTGILEIILGLFLLFLPKAALVSILIYLIGFWILIRSIFTVAESCQLQIMGVRGWGWMLVLGILSIIFSFFYLLSPLFGGVIIITFVCVALVLYGLFRIFASFKLRSLNKLIKNSVDEVDYEIID